MALLTRQTIATLVVLLFAVLASGSAALAQPQRLQFYEQEIKAGMLYNFLKYTVWPDSDAAGAGSITVCLFGGDPFGGYLDKTRGRTVNQKTIIVRNIHAINDAAACNLLFINAGRKDDWPAISAHLSGKSILTVSDFDGFTRAGGMIEFRRRQERVNVEINIRAIQQARLTVKKRLLRLANVISPNDAER